MARITLFAKAVLLGLAMLAAALLSGCEAQDEAPPDEHLRTLGTIEVTAQLIEIPSAFPPNDLYDYVYVMKYRVLQVHRGNVATAEIFVGHYNPLKPRATVADRRSGPIGGRVELFRPGDVHRMALSEPLQQEWMGGIVDKYFSQEGTRYWALWVDPGAK